jgi:DUF4097 and DUF4098 domain-containing protein YvlB
MSAGLYDFNIEQGTSFTLSLVYKNSDDNPVNLTGWCARLIWKTNTGISTFTTETTNSNYRFELDEPNGKIILQFPASVTNDFDFGTARYDLELQSPDDLYTSGGKFTTRILYGTITLIKRFSQTNTTLECNT